MKKSVFNLMTFLMALTLCFSFSSCKDDSNDADDDLIYGTWQSMRVSGNNDTSETLRLLEKGEGSWSTYDETRSFKFSFSNNKLKMTFKVSDIPYDIPYTVTYKVELLTDISLNIIEDGHFDEYHRYRFSRKLFENNNQNNNDDQNDDEQETLTTIDGFKFVDLGLSVKWAASNLNGYYQYGNPSANDFKTEYGLPTTEIGGTSDDPAYANMSNKWRLPTRTEMQELVNNCTWEYTYDNGSGFRVTGPNGNSIFLTCDGAYPLGNESSLLYFGYQCWLMTSTLDNSGNKRPYILKASYINSYTSPTVTVTTSEAYRISGMSVRGVSIADPDVRNK